MLARIKKFSFFKLFSKKWVFFCLSLFLLAGLLYPFHSQAIVGLIMRVIPRLALGGYGILISAALHLMLLFGEGFLALANLILQWSLGNPFAYSFTNPANNPVIEIGWTFLRDLVNMFFIVGLAYIGLATALNLSGFNTKKTFKNLIIIALLINFTPVICGLIVDATNLVMHFFTDQVKFGGFDAIWRAYAKEPWTALAANLFDSLHIVKLGLLLFYVFTAILMLLLFAFIFVVRNLVIWTLVILSPFAFFCWAFDGTKKYFSQWWNQFIQWAIIGIPAGFFLYLASHLLLKFSEGGALVEMGGSLGEAFAGIAPYLIVLFFMMSGFITTLTTASKVGQVAKVAKFAGFIKKHKGTIGKGFKAVRQGGRTLKNYALRSERVSRIAGATNKFVLGGTTPEEKEQWSQGGRRIARWTTGTVLVGALARKARGKMAAMEKKSIDDARSKTKGKTLEEQEANLENALSPEEKIGALEGIAEDGNVDDVNITKTKLKSIIKKAVEVAPDRVGKILKNIDHEVTQEIYNELQQQLNPQRFAEVTKAAGISVNANDQQKYGPDQTLLKKLRAEIKPSAVKYLRKSGLRGMLESQEFYQFGYGDQLKEAMKEGGAAAIESYQIASGQIPPPPPQPGQPARHPIPNFVQIVQANDKGLYRFLTSNAAQDIGLRFPEGGQFQGGAGV